MSIFKSVWFYRLIRWMLATLFIWAGGTKLVDPQAFGVIIRDFGIVPEMSIMPIAIILPVLEVVAAIGLIFNMRGSLEVITGLLAMFIAILGYGIWLGLDIDCGCFGPEDPESRAYNGLRSSLYRDLAMMDAIFFLYFWRFRQTADAHAGVIRNNSSPKEKHQLSEGIMKISIQPILISAIALLIFGLSTSAFGFGDNKFEKEVETEQSAVKLTREVQRGGYDVITTEELKKLIDSGKEILVVDTMPYEDSYQKQHIPGAKQFLFPIPEMETWDTKETDGKTQDDFAALLGPDKDKTIVIYCGYVKCTRSHNGAMWAKKLGYTNVLRQPGGIYAWLGAGYPTESSK